MLKKYEKNNHSLFIPYKACFLYNQLTRLHYNWSFWSEISKIGNCFALFSLIGVNLAPHLRHYNRHSLIWLMTNTHNNKRYTAIYIRPLPFLIVYVDVYVECTFEGASFDSQRRQWGFKNTWPLHSHISSQRIVRSTRSPLKIL
jgi:hypothetical protein